MVDTDFRTSSEAKVRGKDKGRIRIHQLCCSCTRFELGVVLSVFSFFLVVSFSAMWFGYLIFTHLMGEAMSFSMIQNKVHCFSKRKTSLLQLPSLQKNHGEVECRNESIVGNS